MATKVHHRVGGWLPKNQQVLEAWLDKKIKHVESSGRTNPQTWDPVIIEFQRLIEDDPEIWMGFHQMFEQVPTKPPYDKDPTGKPQVCHAWAICTVFDILKDTSQVRDYMLMLALFNCILTESPVFEQDDLVGFPINAILDWPMGTPGGFAAFLNDKVNAQFLKMFDVWTSFLTSEASCYVLTTADNGWFGPAASAAIPNFDATFVCEPDAPYKGFTSWDNFFTRLFRDGVRPVQFPDNDSIVNSACESTIYNIATDVAQRDRFWIKEQKYSLQHMLNNDPLASRFIGGTVYQAFLSALNYHRWHSPVNGTVKKTALMPGTYYSESPAEGMDPAAPNNSQGYITAVATRAMVFIEADNPNIGLMCFMAVGMAEVSTCQITVKEGQRLKKGDELGTFHFGGSTHCLIFRPETKVTFNPDYPITAHVPLNVALATIGN